MDWPCLDPVAEGLGGGGSWGQFLEMCPISSQLAQIGGTHGYSTETLTNDPS